MAEQQWYVAENGRAAGPYPESEVVAGIGSGRWNSDTHSLRSRQLQLGSRRDAAPLRLPLPLRPPAAGLPADARGGLPDRGRGDAVRRGRARSE